MYQGPSPTTQNVVPNHTMFGEGTVPGHDQNLAADRKVLQQARPAITDTADRADHPKGRCPERLLRLLMIRALQEVKMNYSEKLKNEAQYGLV